jgi:uncharacterized cupredoxin-like copper-binding protein
MIRVGTASQPCEDAYGSLVGSSISERAMKAQLKILLATVSLATLTLWPIASAWADGTIRVSLTGEKNDKKMSMKLDVDTVKAGNVTFVVTNDAKRTPYEMILVKLKAKGEQLPLDNGKHRINEKQINSLGEIPNLKPGASGQLKAKVVAGEYLLICNIKGHYEAGMVAMLTVAE